MGVYDGLCDLIVSGKGLYRTVEWTREQGAFLLRMRDMLEFSAVQGIVFIDREE